MEGYVISGKVIKVWKFVLRLLSKKRAFQVGFSSFTFLSEQAWEGSENH